MVSVVQPLVTSRFTESDFKKNSVLNSNVTIELINSRMLGSIKHNKRKIKNSKARSHRSKKY